MRTFIEISDYELPSEGRAEGRASADLVGNLSMSHLDQIEPYETELVPQSLPDGVFRCMGPYWNGRIDPIREVLDVTSYCDGTGVVLQIGTAVFGFSPPESFERIVQIAGVTFNSYRVDGDDLLLTGRISHGRDLIVRSSLDLVGELTPTLASIEAVRQGQGTMGIRDGSDNYRSRFSEEWVRSHLSAIGASNIVVEPVEVGGNSNVLQAFFRPAEDLSVELTGYFWTYPEGIALNPPFVRAEMQTYEQVTIFVLRPDGVDSTLEHEALAYCGGITLHVIGDVLPGTDPNPVIESVRSLIYNIDC